MVTFNASIRQTRQPTKYGGFLDLLGLNPNGVRGGVEILDPIVMTCSTTSSHHLQIHLGREKLARKLAAEGSVGSDSFLKYKIQEMNNLS